MKKLKLNLQQLKENKVLSREQLKTIIGGRAESNPESPCANFGEECSITLGNCCEGLYCNSFTNKCAYISR